jgi:hypothetical protein
MVVPGARGGPAGVRRARGWRLGGPDTGLAAEAGLAAGGGAG